MIVRDTNIQRALKSRQRGWVMNPFRFGGAGGDPLFANVALLLHFDEQIPVSLNFIDSSLNNRTVADVFPAAVTTTNAVFDKCMVSPGAADRATISNLTGLSFGTGDFAIEGWVYVTNIADFTRFVLVDGSHTGRWFFAKYPGDRRLYVQFNGSDAIFTAANSLPLNQNAFVQWIRESGVSTIAVDGVSVYSAADTRNYQAGSAALDIGGGLGGNYTSYFDDWRITVGAARPIVVPTAPFPNFA